MSQKPETAFRNRVRRDLNKLARSGYLFFEAIQQRAICGTPDYLLCVDGLFIGLELKANNKSKVSRLQEAKLKAIASANGIGVVTHPENWEHWLGYLSALITEAKQRDQNDKANVPPNTATGISGVDSPTVAVSDAGRAYELPD